MSISQPQLPPNPIAVLGIVLVSSIAIVPVMNGIALPLEESARSIVSYTSIKNLSPDTDYLKCFLLLLFPSLLGSTSRNRNRAGEYFCD